jgi:N-acetylmuramoyl-L-alanine amidase
MMRTLRIGMRGLDVERWQRFLESHGNNPGTLDGIFGKDTDKATRDFQAARGLKVDGVVGPKTLGEAGEQGLRVVRRLKDGELTPTLIAEARKILAEHHDDPFGTEVPFDIDGAHFFGRIEEHFHPPGGPRKPWGPHVGVSLFLDTKPDKTVEAPDDATDPPGPPPSPGDDPAVIATRATIVIDPGHGGSVNVGGSGANHARGPSTGTLEKDLTLTMAKLVREKLAAQGAAVQVELTRNSDVNLGLADRAKVAKDLRADLFLSIHFNGAEGAARGVEALVRPKAAGNVNHAEDTAFARRVQGAVFNAIRGVDPTTKDRGVKDQELGVLRDDSLGNSITNHPCRACLLEIEFLHMAEVDKLFNVEPQGARTRDVVADAVARALLEEVASA